MPVSREAVRWGFRFFLGRDPESEQAIIAHSHARDEAQLAENLIRSPEFAASRRFQFTATPRFVDPWDASAMEIDTDATPAELAACLTKIGAAWAHLGKTKPHFSVLTNKAFLPENLGRSIDNFWSSGDTEAKQALAILERYGLQSPRTRNCVEYGCGVGRLTTALSRHFARVDGYDISPDHLEYAKQRTRELEIENVGFHQCPISALPDLKPCDAFYSRLVFQHNPPPLIVELIRRSLLALKPGGIALFQVPVYMRGYRFNLREWLTTDHPLDMQMHCLPQKRIYQIVAECACMPLEVSEDSSIGQRERMVSDIWVVQKNGAP